jgi:hypothetical protein
MSCPILCKHGLVSILVTTLLCVRVVQTATVMPAYTPAQQKAALGGMRDPLFLCLLICSGVPYPSCSTACAVHAHQCAPCTGCDWCQLFSVLAACGMVQSMECCLTHPLGPMAYLTKQHMI